MLSPNEIKIVLEAALLATQEPLPVAELRRMFDDEIDADTLRKLLAIPDQGVAAEIPRAHPPRAGAALFARRAGDARDHRLPAAGDAWRHRERPRRLGLDRGDPAPRGAQLGRGAGAQGSARASGPLRDHQDLPGRPRAALARGAAAPGRHRQ